MHLPPVPRFLARWTIRAVLVVLFVGLPGVIFYLREVGVGFGLREKVAEALSGEAFRTTIGRLSLDPFQGLVAERVEVVEGRERLKNLARIERLVVSLNFRDLLAGKLSINHIELDETDVSIPLGSAPGGARVSLKGVTAQCLFLPDQLRVSSFEGTVQGVRVVLSGLLQNPQAFRMPHKEAKPGGGEGVASAGSILEKIAEWNYPANPLEIRAEISGDLADLSTLRAGPIMVRSGPIVTSQWQVEGVDAEARYAGGVLTIPRLEVRGQDGSLRASAQWSEGVLDFQVASSLRTQPFFELLAKDSLVRQVDFLEPPQFEASGRADMGTSPPRYHLTGSLQFGKFSFKGVTFDAFSANFAARDGTMFARDARLMGGGGQVEADVFLAPEDFRLRLTNTIAPTVFAPLLGPNEQTVLKTMEFRDPPYVQFEVRGPKPNLAVLKGSGFLRLGRTAMRGSWLDWGQSQVEIADRAFTYKDFSLGRGKATGSGTLVYDFGGQQVLLQDIQSTMPPVDVMMWVDPKIAEALKPYRFRQPPKVTGEGMVHMKEARKNNLRLKVEAADGLDYDLLDRTLRFGRTQADVRVAGTRVLADVTNAKLMGGDVALKADVSIDENDPTFGADVDIRRVNFAQLTKLYFDYDDSKGVASGKYKFTARMGQEEKMRGEGSIRVEDGHVFAIPILGPLSEIINRILPGSGLHPARLATADFTVADEKITTKNLVIEGAGFSMIGNGDIFFMKDKMDMSVRINARGLPGIVLFPVSKLFEYVSTGSVSNPEWRPKIIPRFGNDE